MSHELVKSSPTASVQEVVRAGAGAGKTTQLVGKVLKFVEGYLEAEGRKPRIVVTTFTRKATQELKERLMAEAMKREDPIFVEFVSDSSHLLISTIHGVLSQYLLRYGGLMGLDPQYQTTSTSVVRRWSRRILRDLIFERAEWEDLLSYFSFKKLCEMVERLSQIRLGDRRLIPFQMEDFEAALREQIEDWKGRLSDSARSIEAQCRGDEKWLQFAQTLVEWSEILSWESWISARKELLDRLEGFRRPTLSKKEPQVGDEELLQINELLKELRDIDSLPFDPEQWELFVHLYRRFEDLTSYFEEDLLKMKLANGKITFEDLELLSVECVRRHPKSAQSFSSEWDCWLIDEYQDTSPRQVELLSHLTKGRSVYTVGDPQQSIYLFRGARSEVFREREDYVRSTQGKQSELNRNFRSTPELLLFFNDFFSSRSSSFRAMEPSFKEGQKLNPQKVVATFVQLENSSKEDEWVTLLSIYQRRILEGVEPHRVAVLARTNQELLDLAGFLERRGVPTQVHSSSGFYDRREVQDALALLRFLINVHDNMNLIQLLRSPWFCADESRIVEIVQRERPTSYWEVLYREAQSERSSSSDHLRSLLSLGRALERVKEVGIGRAFKETMINAGFFHFAHQHDSTGRRESNLWKLVTRLVLAERQVGFNYLEFIDESYQAVAFGDGEGEGDAVSALEPSRLNLMTIHGSKGLQFDHLFLLQWGKGQRSRMPMSMLVDDEKLRWGFAVPLGTEGKLTHPLPSYAFWRRWIQREEEERERLLYVALTRAKESVTLLHSGSVEKNSWLIRSPNLIEAPEGCTQTPSYRYEMIR